MKNVMLWAGAGQIGLAIARRIGAGMKIVVGDKKPENAQAAAKIMQEAGFDVVPTEMDLSSRDSIRSFVAEGQKYGPIHMLVNAAGVSPSQAPIEAILKVDLYGTAVLLEEVGKVIAPRRFRCHHFQPVRLADACPDSGAGCSTGHRSRRRTSFPGLPAAGKHPGYPPRLSAGQALQ